MTRPDLRILVNRFLAAALALGLLFGLVASAQDTWAAARDGSKVEVLPPPVQAPNILDTQRRFDANDLDMWTTNFGALAYDVSSVSSGLEFPRGSGRFVMFGAGLWVGAYVTGEKRVTVAEYVQEWAPGRVVGGTFESPYGPELRTWKVVPLDAATSPADSGFLASPMGDPIAHHAWSEYVAQGSPTGAPVDIGGPDLPGDLALWGVFNDADPNWHSSDAGFTAPLGLEVRQEVFGFRNDVPGVAFVRWTLVHRGASPLDSAYVGFWTDPDVGGANDDLVGWNGFHALGYAYNGQDVDAVYGANPPATGVQYLGGPLGAPIAAFAPYGNGQDPNGAIESYRLLQGLDRFGNEYVDPALHLPSRFPYTGDPAAGTGWLDPIPSDRRMMVSIGPLALAPGDSVTFTFALLAAQGEDRLDSIERLKCGATAAREAYVRDFVRPFSPLGPECDAPVPVALTLEEAAFENGAIRLSWYVAGEDAGPFDLARRRDESEAWSPLGRLTADGTRRIRYEDRAVLTGERWTYGLFDPHRPDAPLHQIAVKVPGAPALLLELRVEGESRVHFTLPTRGEARIEQYDATGRRLGSHSFGPLEPGTYARPLPRAAGTRPGLVFVRLIHAGESVTVKAVLLD